jgi:hypothetical protein
MAMIPTMTARTPSKIIEVDVDLNTTGIPFRLSQAHHCYGKSEAPAVPIRCHGRERWPTSASYGDIAVG